MPVFLKVRDLISFVFKVINMWPTIGFQRIRMMISEIIWQERLKSSSHLKMRIWIWINFSYTWMSDVISKWTTHNRFLTVHYILKWIICIIYDTTIIKPADYHNFRILCISTSSLSSFSSPTSYGHKDNPMVYMYVEITTIKIEIFPPNQPTNHLINHTNKMLICVVLHLYAQKHNIP